MSDGAVSTVTPAPVGVAVRFVTGTTLASCQVTVAPSVALPAVAPVQVQVMVGVAPGRR